MRPLPEQVDLFKAAAAARRDESTVIIARTAAHAMSERPNKDFLRRIEAYSATGADAILLPVLDHHGLDGRADIEAAHSVTGLPLIAVGLSPELQRDSEWLAANCVRVRVTKDNWAYRMAIKAVIDCFEHLESGGDPAELEPRCVPLAMAREVMTHSAEFKEWSARYDKGSSDTER
jgi:2-methylisocitrate lyase-like PEP mutase family enzyme